MAIAFQSQQNMGAAATMNITVTKPASTVAGDLLIAHLVVSSATASFTGLNGFTSIIETVGADLTSRICYRVCDGTEGASFTFTTNAAGDGVNKLACVSRFTGARRYAAEVISASSGQATAASATITAPTVTPLVANSMVVFFAASRQSVTFSGYSMVNNNPTWTEIIDGSQTTISFASAYALRSQTSATGSITATATASDNKVGQAIVISEMPLFTVSDNLAISDSVGEGIGILINDIIALTDSISAPIARIWTNIVRNVKTWTNLNKD